ncbi:hypothetical protein HYH03_016390 [Edaphochlamys debaryana]|uniref:Uncharacterized protein n=1 Tax=Edaphochlamys debaryana TaxID=47281 RepID=A0A835XL76_9CHLO|nr:hypothetical protein HYH03_016390 [Edaphochlamys debaryana]|eukprot:KAG2484823.1 hypothetical protein HYH03_016390 [Edaphochlamys debaryana]
MPPPRGTVRAAAAHGKAQAGAQGREQGHGAAAGPHGGAASIRGAYQALGVTGFYAAHGAAYTNPHEGQIAAALGALLDATPAAVWLGLSEPSAGLGAGWLGDASGGQGPSAVAAEGAEEADGQEADGEEAEAEADAGHTEGNGHATWVEAPPAPSPEEAAAIAYRITKGHTAPVPLRILDLACGSGEVTASLLHWNRQRPMGPAPGSAGGGGAKPGPSGPARARGKGGKRGGATDDAVLLPYDMRITACDPYTGAAYLERTGRQGAFHSWSFEDIGDGCLLDDLDEQEAGPACGDAGSLGGAAEEAGAAQVEAAGGPAPRFDLTVCSFALHLCPPSRLHGTLSALALASRWLMVLAPHKRPHVGPQHGWALAAASRLQRTQLRLYRSLALGGRGEQGQGQGGPGIGSQGSGWG